MKEPKPKGKCQLCGKTVELIKISGGISIAVEHHQLDGRYCEGSKVFARPIIESCETSKTVARSYGFVGTCMTLLFPKSGREP